MNIIISTYEYLILLPNLEHITTISFLSTITVAV